MTNEEIKKQQEEKLKELISFCKEHDIPLLLICDEKGTEETFFVMDGKLKLIIRMILSVIYRVDKFRNVFRELINYYDKNPDQE